MEVLSSLNQNGRAVISAAKWKCSHFLNRGYMNTPSQNFEAPKSSVSQNPFFFLLTNFRLPPPRLSAGHRTRVVEEKEAKSASELIGRKAVGLKINMIFLDLQNGEKAKAAGGYTAKHPRCRNSI